MLTREELINMVIEHSDSTDFWVVDADGDNRSIRIVENQDATELLSPHSWPKYLIRADLLASAVAARGPDAALQTVHTLIALLEPSRVRLSAMAKVLGAAPIKRKRRGPTP